MDMANSQHISIASQWGRSMVSNEKSDLFLFIRSLKRFENWFVAVTTDISASGLVFSNAGLYRKRQKDGEEHTKCVRQVIGRMGYALHEPLTSKGQKGRSPEESGDWLRPVDGYLPRRLSFQPCHCRVRSLSASVSSAEKVRRTNCPNACASERLIRICCLQHSKHPRLQVGMMPFLLRRKRSSRLAALSTE